VMADDALRMRLAARAIEARERFSIARVAAMWESLFAEPPGPALAAARHDRSTAFRRGGAA